MHGDFYDLTDSDVRSLTFFPMEDRKMVTILGVKAGTCEWSGKESSELLDVKFADGSFEGLISFPAFKKMLLVQQRQKEKRENGKKQ